jgi:hypothetical protein
LIRRTAEEDLQHFARLQVRAGLLDDDAALAEVTDAIGAELPGADARELAGAWLAAARRDLTTEQAGWAEHTDYDRLQEAFADLETLGVRVLQGVDDHWTAKAELERLDAAGTLPLGVAWFTAPDVWHAVDHGMLEVNLWHGSTANAAPGDPLLDSVLGCLARHGLEAHFDEGRIEVGAYWSRRVVAPGLPSAGPD